MFFSEFCELANGSFYFVTVGTGNQFVVVVSAGSTAPDTENC